MSQNPSLQLDFGPARHGRLLLTAWVLTLAAALPPMQPLQASEPSEKARVLAHRVFEEAQLPGLQAAVLVDGELVWHDELGFAHLEHQAPITEHSRLRIGSLSKSLTSAALAVLVEEGRLDLDKSVARYLPEFPKKKHDITLRQLAAHVSGVPHYSPAEIVNTKHYSSVTDALKKFKDKELLFPPGERFEYSSYGWNLIGAVIEQATEQTFTQLLESQVFAPLGLQDTIAESSRELIPRRAQAYVVTPKKVFHTPAIHPCDAIPSGGFLSSASDLVRFVDRLFQGGPEGRLVGSETLGEFTRVHQTSDGEPTGYGLGWQDQKLAGFTFKGHGGSHVGATADLWYLPERRLAIALITNTNTSALQELLEGLAAIYLE